MNSATDLAHIEASKTFYVYDKACPWRCCGLTVLQKSSTAEKIGAGGNQRYKPTLIQVVPWRGAEPNGVADYSLALARALAARHGVKSVFLSGTRSAQAMPMQDEWKTVFLPRRQAQCIADTLWSLSAETPGGCGSAFFRLWLSKARCPVMAG